MALGVGHFEVVTKSPFPFFFFQWHTPYPGQERLKKAPVNRILYCSLQYNTRYGVSSKKIRK